jgi:branched-subunit amino acid aminotransferase/4-amino-4-deoxychorismate lyase
MTDFIQANTNGRLHAAHEPSLAPLDRGFLYGDAIYEVWRTYHGVVFAWAEHWRRLEASAAALQLALPGSAERIFAEIQRTVAAFYRQSDRRDFDVYVRLQISRGSGPIGLDIKLADQSSFVLLVQRNVAWTPEQLQRGLTLSLATTLRRNPVDSLNPAWKTGNYLNNILGLREARARGADEVVLTNHAGEIAEAAVSNIGFIRGDELITPPLSVGILGGITRSLVLAEIAGAAGLQPREATVRPDDLGQFEECFLMSTTKDISPVAKIDRVNFRLGSDSATLRLKSAFADYTRTYAAAHPAWRV